MSSTISAAMRSDDVIRPTFRPPSACDFVRSVAECGPQWPSEQIRCPEPHGLGDTREEVERHDEHEECREHDGTALASQPV
jgi:hypothetical protein